MQKGRVIKLLEQLIAIDSQNPPGDEARIGFFVSTFLKKIGVDVKIYEFKKNRSNVVAILPGKNRSKRLLLSPHLDTVPAGKNWHYKALVATRKNGKLYGLGATDCKGNLAVMLEAVRRIVESKIRLNFDLILAATADEESGSGLGLIPLLARGLIKADAAIILDADDFDIIVAQKGLIHIKVIIKGKRAHGAYPWLGINAIDIAITVLKQIKAYAFSVQKSSKFLRSPTINIGTIRGGDKVNIVADWAEFEIDIRFLPGDDGRKIIQDIRAIIKRNTKNFKLEVRGLQKPYLIEPNETLVKDLSAAIRSCGRKPLLKGSEGATVITFFQDYGVPAVATGFGSGNCAHSIDEYAKIDNLEKGVDVLLEFLKRRK